MRRASAALVVVFSIFTALVAARTSSAVGPALIALRGATVTAPGRQVGYLTRAHGLSTRVLARRNGRTLRTLTLDGAWGVQLATLDGGLSGLSANGRVLVLSDNVEPAGVLRKQSHFAVVDTRTLKLTREVSLRGEFSVDALSPDGRFLYLIQHVSGANLTKYQVRGYDLRAGRLLPGTIADKSQAGWVMAGYPVTRAEADTGAWVYTLYRQDGNYPFVHALDTVHHTAVCIGLPEKWDADSWVSSARLELAPGRLEVKTSTGETRYVIDTATFRVTDA